MQERVGLGAVGGLHPGEIPLQFLSHAVGDVAEEGGFREGSGILEPARGGAAEADGFDPLAVVAEGVPDEGAGATKALEVRLWPQHMAAVVGEQLALGAHEQNAAAPLLELVGSEEVFRVFAAVVPGEFERARVLAGRDPGGELITDDHPGRGGVGVHGGAFGLDGGGVMEVKGPEGQVHEVASEVGEGSAAEMPPIPPLGGGEPRVIGPLGDGSEPEVPIEFFGHRGAVGGEVLAAVAGGDPDMDLVDPADGLAADEFDDAPVVAAGVDLRANLGHPSEARGRLGQRTGLGDGSGEGFFAIDVVPGLEGGHGGDGVGVIRGGDDDGVEAGLFNQATEIAVGLRVGEPLVSGGEAGGIHVTEGGDLGEVLELVDAEASLAPHAHDADLEFVVGGDRRLSPQEVRDGEPKASGGGGGAGEETAASQVMAHNEWQQA